MRDYVVTASGERIMRDGERTFTEHWTLALDGSGEWPWRIADTGVPTR